MQIQTYSAKSGDYYKLKTDFSAEFNAALLKQFLSETDQQTTRKTHYFGGRYENIYIDKDKITELQQVLATAIQAAEQILAITPIKAGCWFNAMPPGHRTTAHRHDDDDELLSGVYYVNVLENSGRLILGEGDTSTVVQPQAGMFAFFPPTLVHEVEENKSQEMRLSIGMNFGKGND